MTRTKSTYLAVLVVLLAPLAATAGIITSSADPLLSDASIIDFTEVSLGSTDPSIGGVGFSGQSVATMVQNNTTVPTSPFLGNQTVGTSGGNVDITFGDGVSAFGMMLWAVNSTTMIEAYDIFGNLLSTATLVPTGSSLSGFLGLGGFSSSIWSATVVTTDYLGIDDVHFVTAAVPEPGTLALFGIGLFGIGLARRKKV